MPFALATSELLETRARVGARWVAAGDDGCCAFDVANPATGEVLAAVPSLSVAQVEEAIHAAQDAFGAWKSLTAKKRANVLHRWYELMMAHQDDLARILTAEQGKPLTEARQEIAYAASFLQWFAEEARRVYGETIPAHLEHTQIIVTKEPVGVTAAITPWNFPSAMITRKAGAALAAGCTMVVKPAEQTPLSALALAKLAEEAGVSAGVFSVVTGDAETIGKVLSQHPLVRKLSFTGSTEVGKLLMAQSAPTLKRLSLELGGNAPFIVFADADLDAAVQAAMAAKYRNSGQTCVCVNRFLVQRPVAEAFAKKLAAASAALVVGNGMEEGVQQGPLIDMQGLAKVEELVADVQAHGGKILTGGKRHVLGGTFYCPTVIANVKPEARIAREEVFGPVSPIFTFETEAEAIALANATEYGLAAYLFTADGGRQFRVSEALEYGMVGVNMGQISSDAAPFGGVKHSGFGREGSHHGIDEYLQLKYRAFRT